MACSIIPRLGAVGAGGSSALFSDQAINLIGQTLGSPYSKPAEFAQNLIDWSLEDQGLLAIRSRAHFARTLRPLSRGGEQVLEYLNYALALGGLAVVWLLDRRRRQRAAARYRDSYRAELCNIRYRCLPPRCRCSALSGAGAATGVQLALAVVLALRTDPLTASTPQTPLIGAAAEHADRLVIDSNASEGNATEAKSIVIAKRNGQWVLPQYFDAPARDEQASSILTQLAGLKRGLPVATSTAALRRFKLADTISSVGCN